LDGVVVEPAPRRNKNLRVTRADGTGVFVKQADSQAEGSRRTVGAEGSFYAARQAEGGALPGILLPRLVYFDPDPPLLVLELLARHETLLEHARSFPPHEFPIHIWRAVGRCLGDVHRALAAVDPETAVGQPVLPWVVAAPRPAVASLATLSRAALTVVQILQESKVLAAGLRDVGRRWRARQLVHGDVRADNLLVSAEADQTLDLRLVDWELHRRGDPLWDVAGALDVLALEWLRRLALDDEPIPVVVVQSASRALWEGYVETGGPAPRAGYPLLETLAVYCAARLVETAIEGATHAEQLPEQFVLAVQAAENIMSAPAETLADLFGIS
jgi:hypothetical protein